MEKGTITRAQLLKTFMSIVLETRMRKGSVLDPTTVNVHWAPNAFLQKFTLGTTTIWARSWSMLSFEFPHPHAKQRADPPCVPVLCSGLPCPWFSFIMADHCKSVSANGLFRCSLGTTVTRPPPGLCICRLFGTAHSASYPRLLLLERSVLYWGACFLSSPWTRCTPSPALIPSSLSPGSTHGMCYVWFSLSVSTWQSYSRAEQLCLYHPPQHLAQEREMPTAGNWKDGSALKNAWCVCRVPGFGSQHSNPTAHNHLQLQSHETWHLFTHMVYRQAGTHTHMHKINKSFKKKKKGTDVTRSHVLFLHLVCRTAYPKEGNTSPAWPLWFLLVFSGTHQTNK